MDNKGREMRKRFEEKSCHEPKKRREKVEGQQDSKLKVETIQRYING